MGGGAWPFLVGGVICLVNSDNERDSCLLTSRWAQKDRAVLPGAVKRVGAAGAGPQARRRWYGRRSIVHCELYDGSSHGGRVGNTGVAVACLVSCRCSTFTGRSYW